MTPSKKQYGIYMVEETSDSEGRYTGFKVGVVQSADIEKEEWGKLYIKTDGRENYQAAPKTEPIKQEDEELEL